MSVITDRIGRHKVQVKKFLNFGNSKIDKSKIKKLKKGKTNVFFPDLKIKNPSGFSSLFRVLTVIQSHLAKTAVWKDDSVSSFHSIFFSNLTSIVVAVAVKMRFLEYSLNMWVSGPLFLFSLLVFLCQWLRNRRVESGMGSAFFWHDWDITSALIGQKKNQQEIEWAFIS